MRRALASSLFPPLLVALAIGNVSTQRESGPTVPKTWDDDAIAALEIPLANPIGSPKHVSAEYYYRIPVAPIYTSYPVYAPGREPNEYVDRLKQQEPEIAWDDAGHRPALVTDNDWVRAGEMVFDAPVSAATMSLDEIRDPAFYALTKWPTPNDGTVPIARYVVKYDILPVSVGTDTGLTLATRRGTGYYKVPSLRGVWYRGMFGHGGWCATLEDWFDPRRVRDDYVPTGFKPHDRQTFAVNGHPFGLNVSIEDRRALIAFLKTL